LPLPALPTPPPPTITVESLLERLAALEQQQLATQAENAHLGEQKVLLRSRLLDATNLPHSDIGLDLCQKRPRMDEKSVDALTIQRARRVFGSLFV